MLRMSGSNQNIVAMSQEQASRDGVSESVLSIEREAPTYESLRTLFVGVGRSGSVSVGRWSTMFLLI